MESFWKGSFATFTKHVKSVKVISLAHMTQEDWDILDYTKLRPSARYNLDRQIIAGNLYGFYKVTVDQHLGKAHSPHGGKERYYYPVGPYVDPSPTEFPTDFGFDSEINQEDIPGPPAGFKNFLTAFVALSLAEQLVVLHNIQDEAPDPEDELMDEAMLLWDEIPRVLTLLAESYRLMKMHPQDLAFTRKFLALLDLSDQELQEIMDEIEAVISEGE